MMRFYNLSSGSKGNATLVEVLKGNYSTRLLIDCGISIKELERKMLALGLSVQQLDAVFITHEHGDHVGQAWSCAEKYQLPVWCSEGTFLACRQSNMNPHEHLWKMVADSGQYELQDLMITPYTVPHDAREPLQLCCSDDCHTFAIATDFGHLTNHIIDHLKNCHAILLETNHDVDLLANSNYPINLKKRIGSDYGHLSNLQAQNLLKIIKHPNLKYVVAGHLSQQTNHPQLVFDMLTQTLDSDCTQFSVLPQAGGEQWFAL